MDETPKSDNPTVTVDVDMDSALLADAHLPERIGSYRILSKLGEGGMGVVLEAEQEKPARRVALKLIHGWHADEDHVRMFQREAASLARLSHPGIAAIYESGRTPDGQHFLTMELVEGVILKEYLTTRPQVLDRDEVKHRLRLFRKIADAVQYAHQKGVIHRDLKPANIVVVTGNDTAVPAVKVLDFGLARITDQDVAQSRVTRVGEVRGTLAYMSPEQAQGMHDAVDVRSDVYSLGVILYRMLSGKLPHGLSNVSLIDALRIIITEPPRPLRETWPGGGRRLDEELATIVGKSIEGDVERRYASAGALSDDIERYLTQQPILARPPSTAYHLRKLIARNRLAAAFLTATLVGLVGFAVVMSALYRRALDAEGTARKEAETAREVSGFLVQLFRVSDPSEARGREITARELLDKAATRIDDELAEQPELQAQLMDTIGSVYYGLGLYLEASKLLGAALHKRRQLFGNHHTDVALTLAHLAEVLTAQARFDEAEPMYREALATQRQLLGAKAGEVADALVGLSTLLSAAGRHEEAAVSLRESLEIRRGILGDEHLDVARAMENLGMNLFDQGRYDAAETMLRDANAMRRRLLEGSPHPQLADGLNNLAVFYWEQGRLAEADDLLRESLAMNKLLLEEHHPTILTNMNNLALLLHDAGDLAAAEPIFRDVLRLRRQALGEDHPEVATALSNLAFLQHDRGDRVAGIATQRRAIAIYRRDFPDGHPDLGSSLVSLGRWLTVAGHYGEAAQVLHEAVVMQTRILGADHVQTAAAMTTLAQFYLATRRVQEANNTASNARRILVAKLREKHWRTAWAAGVEGASLARLGRFAQAEALLLPSLETLTHEPGSGGRVTYIEITRGYVVDMYRAWGKPEQAARIETERKSGKEH